MLKTVDPLTADDFFTGLFAGLASMGKRTISLRGNKFDAAMVKVYEALEGEAHTRGLELDFRIHLHSQHEDSATVRNGITGAARRDIISLDNPIYQDIRLCISPSEAEAFLKHLPGQPELYRKLAKVLTEQYATGIY